MSLINKNDPILVAGGTGMVGSALIRSLFKNGYTNINATWHSRDFSNMDQKLFYPADLQNCKNKQSFNDIKWYQCNLIDQKETNELYKKIMPKGVIIAAARVGGINANNTYRGQFIYENIQISANLVHFAHVYKVSKLIFLGSACIYPKDLPQPLVEESLLTGKLEVTNEPYSIAKIAGIKLCENYYQQYENNFFSLMPNNLYGPGDNYDLETSHVLPALIRKFHEGKINQSKKVVLWGSGKPRREFLHVDDLAQACLFSFEKVNANDIYCQNISHLNVGTGYDISIGALGEKIKDIVAFTGKIENDLSKPNGMKQKLIDSKRINDLGWSAKISLEEGLKSVYSDYKNSV